MGLSTSARDTGSALVHVNGVRPTQCRTRLHNLKRCMRCLGRTFLVENIRNGVVPSRCAAQGMPRLRMKSLSAAQMHLFYHLYDILYCGFHVSDREQVVGIRIWNRTSIHTAAAQCPDAPFFFRLHLWDISHIAFESACVNNLPRCSMS